jgi:hypothetical protein
VHEGGKKPVKDEAEDIFFFRRGVIGDGGQGDEGVVVFKFFGVKDPLVVRRNKGGVSAFRRFNIERSEAVKNIPDEFDVFIAHDGRGGTGIGEAFVFFIEGLRDGQGLFRGVRKFPVGLFLEGGKVKEPGRMDGLFLFFDGGNYRGLHVLFFFLKFPEERIGG